MCAAWQRNPAFSPDRRLPPRERPGFLPRSPCLSRDSPKTFRSADFHINGHNLPLTTNDESFTVFPDT
ncbi:Uncharacterized protein dnm_016010 [Desulfonema magnum]|uniref:Uncharacterized protein n=1 Tax=Desulfonema magnum TaxID=45655 RepID=A0A975GLH5_9BACT|nr:Uncharacterized protein dnm_016010 [Desulfonema magnum]